MFARAAQRRQAALQAEIAEAEAYLAKVTENNQVLEMQNAALRAELEELRTRLAARAAQQAVTNQSTLNQEVR